MRFALKFLLAVATLLTVTAEALAVQIPYRLVEDEYANAIVRIPLQHRAGFSAGHCTGALIAPNKVLTARHCLELGLISNVVTGRNEKLQEVAVASIASFNKLGVLGNMYEDGHLVSDFEERRYELAANDALVLTLKTAVKDITPLPVMKPGNINTKTIGLPLAVVGYPSISDLKNENGFLEPVGLEQECNIRGVEQKSAVLLTDCTSFEENSGGPMLMVANNKVYVLGVISLAGDGVTAVVNATNKPFYLWLQSALRIP